MCTMRCLGSAQCTWLCVFFKHAYMVVVFYMAAHSAHSCGHIMKKNTTMWCSVLQCVVVCCSVLQCVAVCCSMLRCVVVCRIVLVCVAVCCRVLRFLIRWPQLCALSAALIFLYMCKYTYTNTEQQFEYFRKEWPQLCAISLCIYRNIHKCRATVDSAFVKHTQIQSYEVATISRLLKITGLFCRQSSFLQVSFAKRPIILRSLLIVATP